MKEKKYFRCSVGIDVGKNDLYVYIKTQDKFLTEKHHGLRVFLNGKTGRKQLINHVFRLIKQSDFHLVVMEATGVYYESLAYACGEKGFDISVVLPKQSSYFSKSINQKSKNDDRDSRMLSQMGLEKFNALTRWNPPTIHMKKLRQLVRYRSQLVKNKSALEAQLHALHHSFEPLDFVVEQKINDIDYLANQIKVIEKEINTCVSEDPDMEARINHVCTVKGIGLITVATVVGETFGFELFTSIPQLVSYSGYDVVQNQSGSRSGKTKISKRGNSRIRAALHFPALTAVKHCSKMTAFYNRIYEKNPKYKMIGYVAVQRKLLVLIYALYKKNVPYDENYLHENEKRKNRQDKEYLALTV